MAGSLAATAHWFLLTTAELVVLFLALSFLVGLLQAWLPEKKVRSMFERHRPVTGYLFGAALGVVTPFCTYSTIPVLAGLLRSGAPFGPTMSFLFASPLLDPVVLGVLVFLIGVEGTVVYATLAFSSSVLMGALFSRLVLEKDVKPLVVGTAGACAGGEALVCETPGSVEGPVWRRAWAAALGVPMYVNAETFFPISAALLEKGVGVGAVVAFVITSMGASVPEVVLLGGLFRWRLVAALVASVVVVAVGGGAPFSPP